MSAAGTERTLFSPAVVAAALVAGALSFVAFLWLTAYAPDLSSGRNGGAHALSNGATGFRALGDLLDDVGGRAVRARNVREYPSGGLLVLTPTEDTDPALLAEMVDARTGGRTLIILPKWRTGRLKTGRRGWVERSGAPYDRPTARLLSKLAPVAIRVGDANPRRAPATSELIDAFPAPRSAQTMSSPAIESVVTSEDGALVASLRANPRVFVAADPDMFNTMGLKDPAVARAAIGLLDHITEGADRVVTFDLTLNGFGGSTNLLRLAFEPPFLPATLCLLVAAALAAVNAFHPLGPPIREERAIGFGKAALVGNGADMLVGSGRDALVADRYVDLVRDAAAARLGIAPGTPPGEVSARLDALGPVDGRGFREWANAVRDRSAAPAALHRWKRIRIA